MLCRILNNIQYANKYSIQYFIKISILTLLLRKQYFDNKLIKTKL